MNYGLLSGVLWGLGAVILSIASSSATTVQASGAVYVISCLHDVVCALILFILMLSKRRLKDVGSALKTKNGKVIILAALVGGPIGMTGYLTAISNIGPGYTAIISALYPALGTLLAVIFLKEKMSMRQIVSLSIAILAVMFMGLSDGTTQIQGDLTRGLVGALLCVVGWGSEAVILTWGMQGEGVDDEVALQIRETTSALTYLMLVMPFTGNIQLISQVSVSSIMNIIALAALCGTASYLSYYKALNKIGAARGMAANISYSAWAVVFSFLILKVIPSVPQVICCVVIMVTTVLASSSDWSDFRILKTR